MRQILLLTFEPMSYKEQIKTNELLTKLRVIRDVNKYQNKLAVARKYHMHRNTINWLMHDFQKKIMDDHQKELLLYHSLSQEQIEKLLTPLKAVSKKPKSNFRSATLKQENLIIEYFQKRKLSVGYQRMYRMINRKREIMGTEKKKDLEEIEILRNLTFSQLRWIYRRHWLKSKKRRTANREHRPLYDYDALACFEKCHYDVKIITDKHALPLEIYDNFKLNPELPVIEWNFIDAKSRTRFIAYSHNRTSEFWLHFLLLVIQYLRGKNLVSWDLEIEIWVDNGSEFYSGSTSKKAEWNKLLKPLNAKTDSYNPNHDVRKNLIERSHKTDDEEFYIPRGNLIKNAKDFIVEADWYVKYFNGTRSHSGKNMKGMTPLEKLKACGIYNANVVLEFPTMILEKHIKDIKKTNEIIRLNAILEEYKIKYKTIHFDQKTITKIKNQFVHLSESAHNVLTQYLDD